MDSLVHREILSLRSQYGDSEDFGPVMDRSGSMKFAKESMKCREAKRIKKINKMLTDDTDDEEFVFNEYKDDRYESRNKKRSFKMLRSHVNCEEKNEITHAHQHKDVQIFFQICARNGYILPDDLEERHYPSFQEGFEIYYETGILLNRWAILKGNYVPPPVKKDLDPIRRKGRLVWLFQNVARLHPALFYGLGRAIGSTQVFEPYPEEVRTKLREAAQPLMPMKVRDYRSQDKNHFSKLSDFSLFQKESGTMLSYLRNITGISSSGVHVTVPFISKKEDSVYDMVKNQLIKWWISFKSQLPSGIDLKWVFAVSMVILIGCCLVSFTTQFVAFLQWAATSFDPVSHVFKNTFQKESFGETFAWCQQYLATQLGLFSGVKLATDITKFKHAMDAIPYMISYIKRYLDKCAYLMTGTHIFADEEVRAEMDACMHWLQTTSPDTPDEITKFREFYKYLSDNINYAVSTPSYTNIQQMLASKFSTYVSLDRKAAEENRLEPVVLFIHGSSQVGKSNFSKHMAKCLMMSFNAKIKNTYSAAIFNRMITDSYWTGYSGQFCTMFDDAFQANDETGFRLPEAMEIIHMANCTAYPLNMAHLDDKGRTFFRSPLIIITSNDPKLENLGLKEPSALTNRFTYCLKMNRISQKMVNNSVIKMSDFDECFSFNVQTEVGKDSTVNVSPSQLASDVFRLIAQRYSHQQSPPSYELIELPDDVTVNPNLVAATYRNNLMKDVYDPPAILNEGVEYYDSEASEENYDDYEECCIRTLNHLSTTGQIVKCSCSQHWNLKIKEGGGCNSGCRPLKKSGLCYSCLDCRSRYWPFAMYVDKTNGGLTTNTIGVFEKQAGLITLETFNTFMSAGGVAPHIKSVDFWGGFIKMEVTVSSFKTRLFQYGLLPRYYRVTETKTIVIPNTNDWSHYGSVPQYQRVVAKIRGLFSSPLHALRQWIILENTHITPTHPGCPDLSQTESGHLKSQHWVDRSGVMPRWANKVVENQYEALTYLRSMFVYTPNLTDEVSYLPLFIRKWLFAKSITTGSPDHTLLTGVEMWDYVKTLPPATQEELGVGVDTASLNTYFRRTEYRYLQHLWAFISSRTFITVVLVGAGVATFVGFVGWLFDNLYRKKRRVVKQSDDPHQKYIQNKMLAKKNMRVKEFEKQSAPRKVFDFYRNVRQVITYDSAGASINSGYCLMVSGSVGVAPAHIIGTSWETLQMLNPLRSDDSLCEINRNQLVLMPQTDSQEMSDQVWFALKRGDKFRSVVKRLRTREDPIRGNDLYRVSYIHKEGEPRHCTEYATGGVMIREPFYDQDNDMRCDVLRVSSHGWKGECGLPYITGDETIDRCVVGLHIAGNPNTCESLISPIYVEDYEQAIAFFEKPFEKEAVAVNTALEDADFSVGPYTLDFTEGYNTSDNPFEFIGEVNLKSGAPGKTSWERSVLVGGWGIKDGKYQHLGCPFEDKWELGSYMDPTGFKMINALRRAKDNHKKSNDILFDKYSNWDGFLTPSVVSREYQMVSEKQLIEGHERLANTDKRASVGPILRHFNVSRKSLITADGELVPYIKDAKDKLIQQWSAGIIKPILTEGCLKDQVYTKQKVQAEQFRMFFLIPFHVNMALKQIFGDLFAQMCAKRENSFGVGFNPFGPEWKYIHSRLMELKNFLPVGMEFVISADDVEGWDLKFWGTLCYSLSESMDRYFINTPPGFKKLVFCSLYSLLHPYVLLGKKVYKPLAMMPSGSWVTIFLNTLFHDFKSRCVFEVYCAMNEVVLPFNKYNRCVFTGDDSVIAMGRIKGNNFDWNAVNRAKLSYHLFGAKHVNCFKDGDVEEYDISEIEFLKRKFYYDRDTKTMLCPLNTDSLYRMCLYVQKNKDRSSKVQFVVNAHTAIRESFFHGREFFENFRSTLNPYLKGLNLQGAEFVEDFDELRSRYVDELY